MNITPLDIRRNEFSRAFRGYHREEVESFLTMVADEVEGLVGEHRELTRRVGELQKELDDYRKMERTLMDTLVTAQHASEEMKESSQRDSETTKREAHVRSEQLLENARIEAERLLMQARADARSTLEDARRKAHDGIENARAQAEEILRKTRDEAATLERQVRHLIERRDTFVAGFRAFLAGQLEQLAIVADAETPAVGKLHEPRVPEVTPQEAAALDALDRELAEFAKETASADAEAPKPGKKEKPSPKPAAEDGSEVLIDRTEESA